MTTVVQLDVDLTASYYATPSCFVFGHSRTAGAEKTYESATQHSFSALLAAVHSVFGHVVDQTTWFILE